MNKPKYWVVCPEYAFGPYVSQEAAQCHADRVAELGKCGYTHDVKESDTKPVPSAYYSDRD